MSSAANQNIKGALASWTVESQRSRYSVRYCAMFIFGMLGQMVPDAAPHYLRGAE